MGLLTTRWEGKYDGHDVTVGRNEVTKGFALEWDGQEIAHRTWSWIGLGELHASADHAGGHVDVKVAIQWDKLGGNGKCTVTVDGKPIDMSHVG